jgi:hypothetical protein
MVFFPRRTFFFSFWCMAASAKAMTKPNASTPAFTAPSRDTVIWLQDGTSMPITRTEDGCYACPVPGCTRTVRDRLVNSVFTSRMTLIEHLRGKHGWAHYRRYVCTWHGCDCGFAFPAKLKEHQQKAGHTDAHVDADAPASESAAVSASTAATAVAASKSRSRVDHRPLPIVSEVVDGARVFWCGMPGCNDEFPSYYSAKMHRKAAHRNSAYYIVVTEHEREREPDSDTEPDAEPQDDEDRELVRQRKRLRM